MLRDASFNNAVMALAGMGDKELALAGLVCRMCGAEAEAEITKGKNREIAIEMQAMFGEVTKEMTRRLCRTAADHKAPGGLTEDEAVAVVDKETETALKELEAA